MERNPPRTAKEAALLGAQADRPPFDREADKRHVIASAIRLVSLATGQVELGDDAAHQIQDGSAAFDDAQSAGMPVGSDESAQATANRTAGDDLSTRDDLSLAAMIRADQAASQGFPMSPATRDDESLPQLNSSIDVDPSLDWGLDTSTQSAASGSPPTFLEGSPLIDSTRLPNLVSVMPSRVSEAAPAVHDSQFDASMLESADALPETSDFWPVGSDRVDRFRTMDAGGSNQVPADPAEGSIGSKIQPLSKKFAYPDPAREEEAGAPISFRPFGESASQANAEGAPVEKVRIEFESSMAEVKRDSVLVFTGMEPAFIALVERMGEQDRRDAFALAASRRACL